MIANVVAQKSRKKNRLNEWNSGMRIIAYVAGQQACKFNRLKDTGLKLNR